MQMTTGFTGIYYPNFINRVCERGLKNLQYIWRICNITTRDPNNGGSIIYIFHEPQDLELILHYGQ